MIRFFCRCGYVFEAPDDAAGVELQCPRCHLLNDVPLLGDISAIAKDGTYSVGENRPQPPAGLLGGMLQVYGSTTADGRPIDLRNVPEEADDDIGEYDTVEEVRKRSRPRYDPETGELVKPIPLSNEDTQTPRIDPSTIPFAKPTVNYANNATIRPKGGGGVFVDLLHPMNVVVMGFVLGLHLLIAMTAVIIGLKMLLIAPITLGFLVILIAHYGNVVQEMGPGEGDELPRVLRDMHFSEDFWHPLTSILITAVICYGLAIAFACKSSLPLASTCAVATALAMAGTFFVPAILLTFLCSGSLANLRPDRLLAVIRVCGIRYFVLAVGFVVAIVPYLWATAALVIEGYTAYGGVLPVNIPSWATMWPVSLPLLCLGIFSMHFFCWELGVLYRIHSPAFPWVDQMHIRVREHRPPVPRRKPKYIAPQGDT